MADVNRLLFVGYETYMFLREKFELKRDEYNLLYSISVADFVRDDIKEVIAQVGIKEKRGIDIVRMLLAQGFILNVTKARAVSHGIFKITAKGRHVFQQVDIFFTKMMRG